MLVTALLRAESAHQLLEIEAPRSGSKLQCEIGGTVARSSPKSCPSGHSLCDITCHWVCASTKYNVGGTALGPTFAVGMPLTSLVVHQVLCSQSRQRKTAKAMHPHPLWQHQESTQISAPLLCMHTCKACFCCHWTCLSCGSTSNQLGCPLGSVLTKQPA